MNTTRVKHPPAQQGCIPTGCPLHRAALTDYAGHRITNVQFRQILFREDLPESIQMALRGEGLEVQGE